MYLCEKLNEFLMNYYFKCAHFTFFLFAEFSSHEDIWINVKFEIRSLKKCAVGKKNVEAHCLRLEIDRYCSREK